MRDITLKVTNVDRLTTARNIRITGDAEGTGKFDGSISLTVNQAKAATANKLQKLMLRKPNWINTRQNPITAEVSNKCTGNAATASKLETAHKITGGA